MGATINIFGVTFTTVLAEIPGVTSGTADPDTSAITRFIDDAASLLDTAMRGAGVDPTAITVTTDLALYNATRHKITQLTLARWHRANQREETEWAESLDDDVDAWVSKWVETPGQVAGTTGHARKLTFRQDSDVTLRRGKLYG